MWAHYSQLDILLQREDVVIIFEEDKGLEGSIQDQIMACSGIDRFTTYSGIDLIVKEVKQPCLESISEDTSQ